MVKHLIALATSITLITACSVTSTQDSAPPPPDVQSSQSKAVEVVPEHLRSVKNKKVIGQVEYTIIEPSGWKFESRIDSGATTTSIDARDIKAFERDGKTWVRFNLFDRNTKKSYEIEKPSVRVAKIKRHGTETQNRYVVELTLSMGSISEKIEVTLTDRSAYTYPVLIGRNFLMDRAIIDVSQKFIAK